MQSPIDYHYWALQHILMYIKYNPSQALLFDVDSHIQIKTFNDSDWVTCPNTRRSTRSFYILIGFSLISRKYKKLSIVLGSSTKGEYWPQLLLCAKCNGFVTFFRIFISKQLSLLTCIATINRLDTSLTIKFLTRG